MAKSKILKKFTKKITQSKIFTNFFGWLIYVYAKIVWKTSSWKVQGVSGVLEEWKKNKSFILIGWHNRVPMLPMMMQYAIGPMKALVSLHNDGRIIAGYLKRFNIGIISGSSNNNAKGAALNIMKTLKEDTSVTIIPDGPRGPRMKLSPSPVYFASKTGKPIFIMTYSQKGAKIIEKAWDKMLVPVPFSHGVFYISKPIYVPQNADNKTLEEYRQLIENTANALTWKADKETGLPHISQEKSAKQKRHK